MKKPTYNIVDNVLVPHTAFETAKKRIQLHFEASRDSEEPICVALVGESRTGKSRVLEHIENMYPQYRSEDGRKIPILRIKTPSKPTVKGLVETFLYAIGDPLWRNRGSEIEKTDRLLTLLKKTGTTMVMVDEFQHFYDKTSHKVQHHVSDWLKILVDEAKLALVVAGLPSCMAVIDQNEQLRGRFAGVMNMPRFDWFDEVQQGEFVATLEAFQEGLSQHELPDLTSDNLAFRCYCASGGLIGYLAKILRQATWNAISENRKTIQLQDLAIAYEDAIWKNRLGENPNPFLSTFDPTPTPHMVEIAQGIGTAVIEDVMTRSRKSSPTQIPSASEALVTR